MISGVQKASSEIPTLDEKTIKAKVSEARKVYDIFAQERGFKRGPDMFVENGKTEKSSGIGIHTKGLFLAPHSAAQIPKFDVCPHASSECRANCLGTEAGGNRQYPDAALSSKTIKTHFLVSHPEHATYIIHHEIVKHKNKSTEEGYKPAIRFNGTSDLPWGHMAGKLMKHHSDVDFYDYTKDPKKAEAQFNPDHPKNYKLALSHTGTNHAESNDKDVIAHLKRGGVVALVHDSGKGIPKPTHIVDRKTEQEFPIIDGDKDDAVGDRHKEVGLIHGHPDHGVGSGLSLKGVSRESAGNFLNFVDPDGKIRIN